MVDQSLIDKGRNSAGTAVKMRKFWNVAGLETLPIANSRLEMHDGFVGRRDFTVT
jgi:hypothetical protein